MMLDAKSLATLADVKRGGSCGIASDGFIACYVSGEGTPTVW